MRNWKRGAIAVAAALGLAGAAVAQLEQAPGKPTPPAAAAPTQTAGTGTHQLTQPDVDAWLDGYMPFALHSGDLAGAVVVVVKDGQVLTARGFGYADVEKQKPVDPATTLFRPGSVSKLVTWTAVMQQVEAGKLDLDKDVNSYLDFRIPDRGGQPVTLRQIMTHTGGFEESARAIIDYDQKRAKPFDVLLKESMPKRIFDAGTTPAYSNWATSLAAYIVQRVSGEDFYSYVERHVFQPLNMQTASFRQPLPPALAPLAAQGYPRASQPAKPFEIVGPAPAGSLSASGIDMAKFMIAHLNNGAGILKPETAAMMHNSPLDKVNPKSLIPPLNRMELGFFETNVNGREVVSHLGDTENFHTSLHLMMNEHVGFYVSFNSAGKEGAAHHTRIALFEDFADRYFPAAPDTRRVDAKTAAEHVRMMSGIWQGSRRSESNFLNVVALLGQTVVSADDKGGLLIPAVAASNGAPLKWDEVSPFVWRARGGHEVVAAQVENGQVVRWSFNMVSPFTVFDRVPASRSSGWIMPMLYLSLAILFLTFVAWPFGWFQRRRYKVSLGLEGPAVGLYRSTKILSGLVLAVLIGWILVFSAIMSDTAMLSGAADPMLWFLQIAGAIVFVGAFGIAAWNAWVSWKSRRHWTAKVWNTLVALAALMVLYFAASFGLIAMTANY